MITLISRGDGGVYLSSPEIRSRIDAWCVTAAAAAALSTVFDKIRRRRRANDISYHVRAYITCEHRRKSY